MPNAAAKTGSRVAQSTTTTISYPRVDDRKAGLSRATWLLLDLLCFTCNSSNEIFDYSQQLVLHISILFHEFTQFIHSVSQ
jgi:hypothetical protein